ncbi:hypothetical protein SELSPUOL_01005 [Selenomonas sputigena ATCC 35185]|uniref:Uncharacterized protein n=1 Tax=Selenomonas sputigena (strain ATCC 35185 / DSM 20758 / CCUG 44933 / VPI D19B-28) TaxID=546271 RepID=C9LTJ4_SELS3|nr:hypothetical protein SELSPUOL_01005 [Selenomonas sputigena ATCC 35185]
MNLSNLNRRSLIPYIARGEASFYGDLSAIYRRFICKPYSSAWLERKRCAIMKSV